MTRCRLALFLLAACGGNTDKPAPTPPPSGPASPPDLAATQAAPVEAPAFAEGASSLQLARTVAVRLEPADDSKRIGTVAVDTRVGWRRTASGKGCKRPWVEIEPHGWICGEHVEPSRQPPFGREVPQLERGEVVPGDYGRVTGSNAVTYRLDVPDPPRKKPGRPRPVTSPAQADTAPSRVVEDKPVLGSLTVRIYEELTIEGKRYLRIHPKDKELVLASAVSRLAPSPYMGSRMGDDTGWSLPFGFVWPRNGWQAAWVYEQPNRVARRQIAARSPVPILERATGADGKPLAFRVGPSEWIGAADVRVFTEAPAPPSLRPGERWIDVDLDTQILVAFEGELPVYSTLISSGASDTGTMTGLYRMWLKESEADMKNLKAEEPYSVATVPWTQFFFPDEDLALHTAYWHDQFGKPRSHGCINLAPRDARWLYYWSDPQVPPGWTSATGVVELPGSVVRVRSAADPNPEWKGYARKVVEARQLAAPR